jgi:hypothetical protein
MSMHEQTPHQTDKALGAVRTSSVVQVRAPHSGVFSKAYRFPFKEVLASLEVNTELNKTQERMIYA